MKRLILLTLILATITVACKYKSFHYYKVTNGCSSAIQVVYQTAESNSTEQTLSLEIEETATIYSDDVGIDKVSKYKQDGENLTSFEKMEATKNDTLKSKTDFLKTSAWGYEEKGKRKAEYTLVITDADF